MANSSSYAWRKRLSSNKFGPIREQNSNIEKIMNEFAKKAGETVAFHMKLRNAFLRHLLEVGF